jgi:hypothetical protein
LTGKQPAAPIGAAAETRERKQDNGRFIFGDVYNGLCRCNGGRCALCGAQKPFMDSLGFHGLVFLACDRWNLFARFAGNQATGNRTMSKAKTFTFFCDPGHGWLQVTPAVCQDLGLNRASFSDYSYRDDRYFYLEEDCDAAIFVEAFRAKHGEIFFRESHNNRESAIRRKRRICD